MKARDFVKNALEQMWEDMQTDEAYWPDVYDLRQLARIIEAQAEMAEQDCAA